MRAASRRGGFTFGREMRWMWIHMPSSRSSGTAMCRNTSSEKKRLDRCSGVRKLRASGSPKMGKTSSSFADTTATYCASMSHTSQ